jgi:hypothetical protein
MWWYGLHMNGIGVFESKAIKRANSQTKVCAVDGVQYHCIHGPFVSKREAERRSKLHGPRRGHL